MKESILLFITSLFFSQLGFSQMRMIRATPDSSFMLMEIGVHLKTTSNGIIVEELLPFPSKQKVDVKVGDIVFGISGKNTSDIKLLREIYKGFKADEEIKLGVVRNGQKKLIRFKKSEKPSGGQMMVTMDSDSPDENMEPALLELGITGAFTPKGIEVKSILPFASESTKSELKEGDFIVKVNNTAISKPIDLEGVFKDIKIDDTFTLSVKRDGKTISVNTTKSKAQFNIQRN